MYLPVSINSFNQIIIKKKPLQSVPITTKVASSNLAHGKVYLIQHYEMKFVSDLRYVSGFVQDFSTYKTYRHDITEILTP